MLSVAHVLFYLLAVALVLAGLVGALLPVLPGVPMIYAGLFLAAWVDGFRHIGALTLVLLAVLGLLAWSVDLLAAALGARRVGASRSAVWGAGLGTLIGLFFGLPGVLFGPLLGAVAGELWTGAHVRRAAHVGLATWIGLTLGLIVKLAFCFAMIGVFVIAWMV